MHAPPVLAGLLFVLATATPLAGPRAEDPIVVRPRVGVAAPVSEGRVDHSAYDVLLKRYVDDRGRVDYAAWKAADRPTLERYLEAMAAVRPAELADHHERLAYWINVYNALTLHGMLRFYPTRSIKDHVSNWWGFHFWKDVRIVVSGTERSLDDIEHKILRTMDEPRIHFAIVCASIGCPPLRAEAYTGLALDPGQLDQQAAAFFADPSKFRIHRPGDTVWLSPILDWFGEDFGGTDRALLDFAARYAPSEADREFLGRTGLTVAFLDYDWSLNDLERP